MQRNDNLEFYATASSGTEHAVRDELIELGFKGVRLNRGGIPFRGGWHDGWKACLYSRCAQRIMTVVSRFPCLRVDDYYEGINRIAWEHYIGPQTSIAVAGHCRSPLFTHSGFVILRAKDAIVDRIRYAEGERPSVHRDDPDARIFVYLANGKCTVYLDLSGAPLARRGYRTEAGAAPLRETLAACMIQLSGWDRSTPLLDPMAGSGTIPIEAAMLSANIAPGAAIERFGFERWRHFDADDQSAMREYRGQARRAAVAPIAQITGADCDAAILEVARGNARRAGVKIRWEHRSITERTPDQQRRWVLANPPYDIRMGADPSFCREFAAAISRMHNCRVCMISGCTRYRRAIAAKPTAVFSVKNGDIPAEIIIYDIN